MEDAGGRGAPEPVPAELSLRSRPERWVVIVVPLAALGLWEWSVRAGLVSPLFFPAPSVIAMAGMRMLRSGELGRHVGSTLYRVVAGFALGGLSGLIVGLVMGWWPRLRAVMDPLIAAAHPLPKIALLPLIMIFFGIGEISKIVAVAISAFFPMLINAMAGVRQIHPIHYEVARNYGASPGRVLARVVMPGSLPLVLVGARLAVNSALLVTIAVELISAQEGLGSAIWLAWETLQTEKLYVGLFVIAVLGVAINRLLQMLTHVLTPWQVDPSEI